MKDKKYLKSVMTKSGKRNFFKAEEKNNNTIFFYYLCIFETLKYP